VWWQLKSQFDPLVRFPQLINQSTPMRKIQAPQGAALIGSSGHRLYGLKGEVVQFEFRPFFVFGKFAFFMKPEMNLDLGVLPTQRTRFFQCPEWLLLLILLVARPIFMARYIRSQWRGRGSSSKYMFYAEIFSNFLSEKNYERWLQKWSTVFNKTSLVIQELGHCPRFSIVIPTYKSNLAYLQKTIQSVRDQKYQNWELIIVDDNSESLELKNYLEAVSQEDRRIKAFFNQQNQHISKATDFGVQQSQGEFIGFLDHDDLLDPWALVFFEFEISKRQDVNLVFSDEDKIQEERRSFPHFKPGWSTSLIETSNYVSHFTVIRRSIYNELGGLQEGVEGAQDWDLILRYLKTYGSSRIAHIPLVLYSWRVHDDSTAANLGNKSYIERASKKVLETYFGRPVELAFDGIQYLRADQISLAAEKTFISWAIEDIFLAYHKRQLDLQVEHADTIYPALLRPLVRAEFVAGEI
jgi:glycosyltransferase involved in cell wall biosynthesis